MDKLGLLVGIGILGGVIANFSSIKANYYKFESIYKSNSLVINFFRSELKKNRNITLEDAILKFEDVNTEFDSLEEFADSKGRDISCYINAYEYLFKKAKKIELIYDN